MRQSTQDPSKMSDIDIHVEIIELRQRLHALKLERKRRDRERALERDQYRWESHQWRK